MVLSVSSRRGCRRRGLAAWSGTRRRGARWLARRAPGGAGGTKRNDSSTIAVFFFRGSRGDLEAWSLGGQGRPSGCRPNYYRSSRPSGTRNRGRGLGGVDESALPRNHQDSTRSRGVGEDKGGAACDSRCSNLEWIRRGRDGNKKSRDGIGARGGCCCC